MSLTQDQISDLEDLSSEQLKALDSLLADIVVQFETWLLGCSLGDLGEAQAQQKLVAHKFRHEGALKVRQVLKSELSRIKEAALKRSAASNANPRLGQK